MTSEEGNNYLNDLSDIAIIDLISAIQKATPVHAAASALKEPLKKMASEEGNGHLQDLLNKTAEELVVKHPSIAVIELISSLQKANPIHAVASALKEPLRKMASEKGNKYLHDLSEELIKKHTFVPAIELISSLQKAKSAHTAARVLKEPLKKVASEEGNSHLHDLLDKMVEELIAKHPSIAVIELISSLQKANPVHAAASALGGLSRRQRPI